MPRKEKINLSIQKIITQHIMTFFSETELMKLPHYRIRLAQSTRLNE